MKHLLLSLSLLLAALTAQAQCTYRQATYGANSPSVWAKNVSIAYGMKPSVLDGLADLYQKDGLDSLARRKKVEKLVRDFRAVAPKEQKKLDLSDADRQKLGLADHPCVAEAFEFQLYTEGANSPAIYALGDVKIWYGIPKKAFLGIVAVLESKQAQIEDFGKKLSESVKKFEDLKAELATYGPTDPLIQKAEKLLEEGKILEVERLLDSALELEDRRLAYRHHVQGGVKALLLKYDTAAIHYRKAAVLEPENSTYLLALGDIEHTNDHYNTAIEYIQKALAIDTATLGRMDPKVALDFNSLGTAWYAKAEYGTAITFFEKALVIDSISFGNQHTEVAVCYSNLGSAWKAQGEYVRAITFFKKALAIDSVIFGKGHPKVAIRYNNLGSAWSDKGEDSLAISFFEKALAIDSVFLGKNHPDVARDFNNFGEVYRKQEKYDTAINFFEKALTIDSIVFGMHHTNVAIRYNNLGAAWDGKGEYDTAINFFEKALAIDSIVLGMHHLNIAGDFSNLGEAYREQEKYDTAIAFYEKALAIDSAFFGMSHPNLALRYNNLGLAWDGKGEYRLAITFYQKALAIDSAFHGYMHSSVAGDFINLAEAYRKQGEYDHAIVFYKKALTNAEAAKDWPFSLTCLNNIGSMHKRLGQYAEGLAALEKGIARGEALSRDIDEQLKELPAEQLQQPEVQAKIAELKNLSVIRRMHYHTLDCLAGLGRKKEAKKLAKLLYQEALEAKDERTVEDLKKDGWVK